jgi:hypothetical protein
MVWWPAFDRGCCEKTAQKKAYSLAARKPALPVVEATFRCPTCQTVRLLRVQRHYPADTPALVHHTKKGVYHTVGCPWTSLDAPSWRPGARLGDIFRQTYLDERQPQPCPYCLGYEAEEWLGVRR